jgi:hypothetical protein
MARRICSETFTQYLQLLERIDHAGVKSNGQPHQRGTLIVSAQRALCSFGRNVEFPLDPVGKSDGKTAFGAPYAVRSMSRKVGTDASVALAGDRPAIEPLAHYGSLPVHSIS